MLEDTRKISLFFHIVSRFGAEVYDVELTSRYENDISFYLIITNKH
jgi:hypothetical protein